MNFIRMEEQKRDLIRGIDRIFNIWNYTVFMPVFKIRKNRFVKIKQQFRIMLAIFLFFFDIFMILRKLTPFTVYRAFARLYLAYLNLYAFVLVIFFHIAQDEIVFIVTEIQEIQKSILLNGFNTNTKEVFGKIFKMSSFAIFCNLVGFFVTLYFSFENIKMNMYLYSYVPHIVDMVFQLWFTSMFMIVNHFLAIFSQNPNQNMDIFNSLKQNRLQDRIKNVYDKLLEIFSVIIFMRMGCLTANFLLCVFSTFMTLEADTYHTVEYYYFGFINVFFWCALLISNCIHNIEIVDYAVTEVSLKYV